MKLGKSLIVCLVLMLSSAERVEAQSIPPVKTLRGHADNVTSLAFSPDGKFLVSGSKDKTAKVWNLETGMIELSFEQHEDEVTDVAIDPDGKHAASSSDDGTVRIWELASGKEIVKFDQHKSDVHCVTFSPDGKTVASAGQNEALLWDPRDGTIKLTFSEHKFPIRELAFNPDGSLVASASSDETVKIWQASNGLVTFTFDKHQEVVFGVDFSPDGKHVGSASVDGSTRVWDVVDGKSLFAIGSSVAVCFRVRFSPDGRYVALATSDKEVPLIDAETGEPLLGSRLIGHEDAIFAVAFSPDSKTLASAGADRTIKLWAIDGILPALKTTPVPTDPPKIPDDQSAAEQELKIRYIGLLLDLEEKLKTGSATAVAEVRASLAEVRNKMTPASKDFLSFHLLMESGVHLQKGRPGFAMVAAIAEERIALLKEMSGANDLEIRDLEDTAARLNNLVENPKLITADPELDDLNRVVLLSDAVNQALKTKDIRASIDPLKQIIDVLRKGAIAVGPEEAKELGLPAQAANFLEALAMAQEFTREGEAAAASRQESVAILANAYGPEHWRTLEAKSKLADALRKAAFTPLERKEYDDALKIAHSAEQPRRQGDFKKSSELTRTARDMLAGVIQGDNTQVRNLTGRLASDFHEARKYPNAEQEYLRALDQGRKLLGDHPVLALRHSDLAVLYLETGQHDRAEEQLTAAVKVQANSTESEAEKSFLLALMVRLANLRAELGHLEAAQAIAQQATDYVTSEVFLNDEVSLADRAEARATVTVMKAATSKELPAPDEFELVTALGLNHAEFVGHIAQLVLITERKNTKRWQDLIKRLELELNWAQGNQAEYSKGFAVLAMIRFGSGDAKTAVFYHRRALAILQDHLGADHPECAKGQVLLAHYLHGAGEPAEAISVLLPAMDTLRRHNDERAWLLSSGDQYRSLARDRPTFNLFLTLALAQNMPSEDVYRQVLAWRGQVFLRERWLALQRRDSVVAEAANQLRDVVMKLDARLQDRPGDPANRAAANDEIQRLVDQRRSSQQAISSLAAARADIPLTMYSLEKVREVLPEDVAIIEFVNFTVTAPPKDSKPAPSVTHTLAFVVRRSGPIDLLDLKSSATIDEAVKRWRLALGADRVDAEPFSYRWSLRLGSERQEAEAVRKLVWDQVEANDRLKGISIVLISADGSLAGVPFAALPDAGTRKFLLERIGVVVLPTPQLLPELLADKPESPRLPNDTSSGVLVVGGLDYDRFSDGTEVSGKTLRKRPRQTLRKIEQSRQEVDDVLKNYVTAFPEGKSDSLTGTEASKSEFQRLAPESRWIHLATHGFYAPAEYLIAFGDHFLDLISGGPSGFQIKTDPSVASVFAGVALSGANVGKRSDDPRLAGENGILTALEVGALDLRNADCVFVSACWGGSGLSVKGEGVLSLQRAFGSAGARTVIAGLWSVDDKATRMLVDEYYKNLWGTNNYKRVGKLKALRNAQLAVADRFVPDGFQLRDLGKPSPSSNDSVKPAEGPRIPPFFWAAFTLSGDWR